MKKREYVYMSGFMKTEFEPYHPQHVFQFFNTVFKNPDLHSASFLRLKSKGKLKQKHDITLWFTVCVCFFLIITIISRDLYFKNHKVLNWRA